MPVDKNKEKEEQAFLEGNNDIYSQVKELENKVEWLRNGLKDIANTRDDMNPLFLKKIAQAILDGEPTTADEFNEDPPIISMFTKDRGILDGNPQVKGSRDGYWEPEIPKEQTWVGPNDPGDEHDF